MDSRFILLMKVLILDFVFFRWWFTVSWKRKGFFFDKMIVLFFLELVSEWKRRELEWGNIFRGYTTADPPSFTLLVWILLSSMIDDFVFYRNKKLKLVRMLFEVSMAGHIPLVHQLNYFVRFFSLKIYFSINLFDI